MSSLATGLAAFMAGPGVSNQGSGVISAPRMASGDQFEAASATSNDGDSSGVTIAAAPAGMVNVVVNGIMQELGQGVKTKDCYFSADGGTTARALTAIAANDTLYWNGSVAGFQLDPNDKITLSYELK